MPGPISDSYEGPSGLPHAERSLVRAAIQEVRAEIARMIGGPPRYIPSVVRSQDRGDCWYQFSERQLRIIRFALSVALEEEDL